MAVTHETGLSPQAPPQSQAPSTWYPSPHGFDGSPQQNQNSLTSDVVSGQQKTEGSSSINTQNERSCRKTDEMTDFMDDLTLSSPRERSCSGSSSSCSRRSSSRSSSRSSYSSRSSSSTSSSSSWSRSRSRSRSRAKRNCSRRNRRYSRSYSRSRSRSRSYRYRERYHPRYYSRYRRSPPRYRSRSRSPRRSYYRRSYSRSRSRSRRYYGFGRTIYPEAYRSWRSRSRSRSRSRTPLRLTEKEKRELLEIAKANAAKTLGTDIVLPASLRIATHLKENENDKPKDENVKFDVSICYESANVEEIMNMVSSTDEENLVKTVGMKSGSLISKETVLSPGREEKTSPAGQWIPVKDENVFHNFSPKSTSFRAR